MVTNLKFDIVQCEKKVSARTGNDYILLTGFVDVGQKYPLRVVEFSPVELSVGLYDVPVSLAVSRNNDLALVKDFSKAVLVK